jgi:hypothetical protein
MSLAFEFSLGWMDLGLRCEGVERGRREYKENSKGRATEILTSGKGMAKGKERERGGRKHL